MTITELIEALEAARDDLGPETAKMVEVRLTADWHRIDRAVRVTTDRGTYLVLAVR